jgi:hypothetical protein
MHENRDFPGARSASKGGRSTRGGRDERRALKKWTGLRAMAAALLLLGLAAVTDDDEDEHHSR